MMSGMLFALVPIVVIGLVVLVIVALVQQRVQSGEVSTAALFRGYLYLGSFAGVVALAFGLIALLNFGVATVLGPAVAYGGPWDPGRPIASFDGLVRRRDEDLLRGITFTAFGALFWVAHWLARNRFGPGDQGSLQRAYLFVGTAVFGIATVVFLPNGIYQVLATWVIPPAGSFRQGFGDTLTPGVVSLVLWLAYLRLAVEASRGPGRWQYRTGTSGPPPEPAPVGAGIGPGPSSRSAGAQAVPPLKDS